MQQQIILFDINETVLDLSSLRPKFRAIFGDENALSLWFSKLLHMSTVCIITKVTTDFAMLTSIALDSIAARYGVSLSGSQRSGLLIHFASLSAHADIKPALVKLRDHGFRTVAFSNSSLHLISEQMKKSGLTSFFDEIISVEETGSFKPSPSVYQFVAGKLNVPVQQLRLVAAHDWDTHGAISEGLKAAYIDRIKTPYNPLYQAPDIQAETMGEIVDQIIRKVDIKQYL